MQSKKEITKLQSIILSIVESERRISHTNDDRYPKTALNGYMRGRGRSKKRWLDTVITDHLGKKHTWCCKTHNCMRCMEEIYRRVADACSCIAKTIGQVSQELKYKILRVFFLYYIYYSICRSC